MQASINATRSLVFIQKSHHSVFDWSKGSEISQKCSEQVEQVGQVEKVGKVGQVEQVKQVKQEEQELEEPDVEQVLQDVTVLNVS